MFKLFSLTLLFAFLSFVNLAHAETKTTTKLETPKNLSAGTDDRRVMMAWDNVPLATNYRVVISADRNFEGFTDKNDKSYCDPDTCVTFTTTDTAILSLKPFLPKDFVFLSFRDYYVKIRATSSNKSKSNSDWGIWVAKLGQKVEYATAGLPPEVMPVQKPESILYSKTDKCPQYLDWCASPTFELNLGLLSMSGTSLEPINLISNSYVIDKFKRHETKNAVKIAANVYNRGYADAMIDIYDAKDNWIDFVIIPGHRPETSIVGDIIDKWATAYEGWYDDNYTLDPRKPGNSKKQKDVNLSIPLGGYAVMSKNRDTAIANTILNTSLEMVGARISFIPKGKAKMQIIKLFMAEIAKSSFKELVSNLKIAISQNNKIDALDISKNMTKEAASIGFKVLVTDGDKIAKILGKNNRIYQKILGYRASRLLISASGVGGLVTFSEDFATGLGLSGQLIDIANANDDKSVTFK